jgi:hypothetical protein
VDENAGHISGDGVAAHHDVGIAALLEVRIEDCVAGRAPSNLPLRRVETLMAAPKILWSTPTIMRVIL